MSVVHHKVGSTFYLSFNYPNNSTSMTTGKVSGNFTLDITKNGTGGQATTGCTFAEVSSVTDPGLYQYACSGSTSFVSATGVYDVSVYDSSDFTKLWSGQVQVTSDGTGAGTWGDASFTATTSNGRVYDGALAVDGATIYINNSDGALWAKLTSNSSGLWGPVYFNSNGTYDVYAQKSGYSVASGTITVSGSSATGPGTDLTITASSTAGTLLASDYLGYVRRAMDDRTGTLADTVNLEILNEAVELISMERQWPYYQTRGAVSLQAAYETGTVAISRDSTTCTLTGGTWPSWAASGELFVDGVWVEVESRTSDSVIVLAESWGNDNVTDVSYILGKIRYTLPSDCVRISNTMYGINWPWDRATSPAHIEALKDRWSQTDPNVTMWAVEKNFLVVWPIPSQNRQVNLLYFRKPTQLQSGSDAIDWDATQVMLLRRAIDFVCAGRRAASVDEKSAAIRAAKILYDDALSKAWAWDKTDADPKSGDEYLGWDPMRGTVVT